MKILGVILAGVFAGVVLVEIMRQTSPGTFKGVEEKACDLVSSLKGAFKEGYQKTA